MIAVTPLTPPSPHGRGSSLAAIERASPLPWGEGQGEGGFPRSLRHALILARMRQRENEAPEVRQAGANAPQETSG